MLKIIQVPTANSAQRLVGEANMQRKSSFVGGFCGYLQVLCEIGCPKTRFWSGTGARRSKMEPKWLPKRLKWNHKGAKREPKSIQKSSVQRATLNVGAQKNPQRMVFGAPGGVRQPGFRTILGAKSIKNAIKKQSQNRCRKKYGK